MPKPKPRHPARATGAAPAPRIPVPATPRIPTLPFTPAPAKPAPPPAPAPAKPAPAPPTSPATRPEALIARLLDLSKKVDADFYEIGRVLEQLNRPDVFEALGYASFNKLLAGRDLPVKRAQAYRLRTIARELDADTARALGVERAYHAIAYAQLVHPKKTPAELIARNPFLSYAGRRYPLLTIPSRLLRKITEDARAEREPKPPPALARTARSLSQRFHHAGLEDVHVKSHPNHGTPYLTIRLPLSEAQKLAQQLG